MRTERVDFHREASIEYDAAFEWYLAHSPDAALRFDAEVDRALEQIIGAPQRWVVGPCSTRKYLLRQFPFILTYRERPSGDVQIVAVAHTSRKPGYWKKRL